MRTRERYLIELGIRPWVLRETAGGQKDGPDDDVPDYASLALTADETAPAAGLAEGTVERWRVLADAVSGCTRCELHRGRTRTVFGTGNRQARLLVIGEAPGAEEDRKGEPFVGRAGQLLNAMLAAIGMDREDVYIANILKCRPPGNRDPGAAEVATCTPYLREQIALLKPEVILAVGRIAAQWLLQTDTAVGRLRGQVHRFGDADAGAAIPLIVSYHPACLLRTPLAKARAWDDLKQVRRLLGAATMGAATTQEHV